MRLSDVDTCDGCGNEVDPDCCWCGGGQDDSEHGGFDYTHPFIPMGCDCFRICGKVREEVGGAVRVDGLGEVDHWVHGKPDRVLAKLVAALTYEQDLAKTGEPQRATAYECGVALGDTGIEVALLVWLDEQYLVLTAPGSIHRYPIFVPWDLPPVDDQNWYNWQVI